MIRVEYQRRLNSLVLMECSSQLSCYEVFFSGDVNFLEHLSNFGFISIYIRMLVV
jgi:hypothetical protein